MSAWSSLQELFAWVVALEQTFPEVERELAADDPPLSDRHKAKARDVLAEVRTQSRGTREWVTQRLAAESEPVPTGALFDSIMAAVEAESLSAVAELERTCSQAPA